jgi:hypothetical protein
MNSSTTSIPCSMTQLGCGNVVPTGRCIPSLWPSALNECPQLGRPAVFEDGRPKRLSDPLMLVTTSQQLTRAALSPPLCYPLMLGEKIRLLTPQNVVRPLLLFNPVGLACTEPLQAPRVASSGPGVGRTCHSISPLRPNGRISTRARASSAERC